MVVTAAPVRGVRYQRRNPFIVVRFNQTFRFEHRLSVITAIRRRLPAAAHAPIVHWATTHSNTPLVTNPAIVTIGSVNHPTVGPLLPPHNISARSPVLPLPGHRFDS